MRKLQGVAGNTGNDICLIKNYQAEGESVNPWKEKKVLEFLLHVLTKGEKYIDILLREPQRQ